LRHLNNNNNKTVTMNTMKTTKNIYGLAPALPVALALMCCCLAVKAQSLYVGSYPHTIGDYGLDGSTVNRSLITGPSFVDGIAISGNDLFVAYDNGTLGEYTTSGATVNADLISGLGAPGVLRFQETTCLSRILAPVPLVNTRSPGQRSMPR
jgi:hypothetical protein